jgi:hypothetical protein
MMFSKPQWNSNTSSYKVIVYNFDKFMYNETRVKSSGELFYISVDTSNDMFNDVSRKFANVIHVEGSSWFASPITPQMFLKKVKHTFEIPKNDIIYGDSVDFTWAPRTFQITPKTFHISWDIIKYENTVSVIPSNYIDFSEELEPRTIFIQQNDIIENAEIPFNNSEQDTIQSISSRAAMLLKQKVRKAKLKAAISTMKAERMAEKYFRRYGVQTNLDSDSDLSFDSEEDSDEE